MDVPRDTAFAAWLAGAPAPWLQYLHSWLLVSSRLQAARLRARSSRIFEIHWNRPRSISLQNQPLLMEQRLLRWQQYWHYQDCYGRHKSWTPKERTNKSYSTTRERLSQPLSVPHSFLSAWRSPEWLFQAKFMDFSMLRVSRTVHGILHLLASWGGGWPSVFSHISGWRVSILWKYVLYTLVICKIVVLILICSLILLCEMKRMLRPSNAHLA